MSRGKYLSLDEARRLGQLDRFAKEHPSVGDWDKWQRLMDAMAHGEPPVPRRKRAASGASEPAPSKGSNGTRTRRDT